MNLISNKSNVTLLFLTGFVSILGQVILLRELNVAFFGIELIYALAFGIWLTGTALGALAGKRNYIPGYSALILLFALSGLLLLSDIVFIRCIPVIFGGVTGAFLPFDRQIVAMFAALLPFSMLMGLLFQWSAKNYTAAGNMLARAYAIECLGGLTGGAVSSLFIFFGLQNFEIGVICSSVCFLLLLLLIHKRLYQIAAGFAFVSMLLLTLFYLRSIDNLITSAGLGRPVESTDTPYNRITISLLDNQVSIFEDNALIYETETTDAEEFVQLAALQAVNPAKVLVLGGGFKGIIEQLNFLPVSNIDYVDYDRKMLQFIREHLPRDRQSAFASEKVHQIFEDPRFYLRYGKKYDLILTGMPEPSSGQNSRFYTVEFFREVSSCLNRNGIFSFRIPSSENFWTPALRKRNSGIFKSLKSAFSHVLVLPGTSNIFIASNDSLSDDPQWLGRRLLSRNLHNKLVIPEYVRYLYTNDRYAEINKMLNDSNAVLNGDIRPVCYQYTLAIWLSKFFPRAASWDFSIPGFINWPVFQFIAGFFVLSIILTGRKWIAFRRFIIVSLAGFQGMVLEIALLLHYQMQNGVLFQNIGVLITGFMAGLSAGAWIVNRQRNKFTGIVLISSSILIYLLFGFFFQSGGINGFISSLLSLSLSGLLSGGLFAWATTLQSADQSKMVSPLYSADLFGGVAGALAANFIFIPMLGLAATAAYMAIPSVLLFFFV